MNSALASLWIIVILAAPSAAQNTEPAPPASERWDPARALEQDRPVPGARSADRMPGDLCGQAAVFPIGHKDNDLKAVLYVPSYYNAARRWPVLIDGNARDRLHRSLQTFRVEAEKHGFILLSVEYLYHTGREEDTHKVWTREGDGAIKEHSRTLPEFLSDMAIDEQVLRKLIITLGRKYSINRKAVGVTGFLGAGLMAYRLPMVYPRLFCTGISRSGGFGQGFMPSDTSGARNVPFYIIYGDKEQPVTLEGTEQAMIFLKTRQFKHVVAEKIPNSGVDSRGDIAANYFRSTVNDIVSDERARFDRAAGLAGRLLSGQIVKSDRNTKGDPPNGEAVLKPLESFVAKHPKSRLGGQAKLLMARILVENLNDRRRAAPILEPFTQTPLVQDTVAPAALLYLAESVMDRQTDPEEVRRVLNRLLALRRTPPPTRKRATELLEELDQR
jgi:poly(3-hydroxybutyrate) depolymerase